MTSASSRSTATHDPSSGTAKIVRCPTRTLERLRRLNEAEIITLFTPFVPHPPSTTLAKDMDPFEPLGRALPRQVRHVPYRLDSGMTEMHADFLPTSGAVIIVICATSNVISNHAQAFERQLKFARSISKKIPKSDTISGLPVILILIDDGAMGQSYVNTAYEFPALVTVNDYNTAALANAVHVLFGN
ncbi:hypothetical protein J4E85_010534 [Alternaria conjuncta]|uniref:uncharacterized protein n=1 Tax=Alternaria conjuncta TaxID=181017 RepID=UPI0022208F7D|nr:uncharacterized protein J4E85_010534 [Alternaria conjuncta]KAI4914471.1 hypothetical protein J4E85_010534 [Alternaria conjuncta]